MFRALRENVEIVAVFVAMLIAGSVAAFLQATIGYGFALAAYLPVYLLSTSLLLWASRKIRDRNRDIERWAIYDRELERQAKR